MHIAEFDHDGVIWFTPIKPKPVDCYRLQKAMFMDRPDLWPCKPRRRRPILIDRDKQFDMFKELEERSQ